MRCFIAAWPDEPTRIALSSLSDHVRQRVEHRRVSRPDDLHLTLAFIGNLAEDIALDLSDAIAKLRFTPFAWQLDALGFFKEAGVVWLGAGGETTEPLVDLGDRVRALLDQMNVAYDRRPLAPHVTLLHGVRSFAAKQVAPIRWCIDSLALYRSDPARQASRYMRVER
ncbi:MAG: RNA 2',3'-cyclic phosphodiesterase [Burkholderiaceae bacterium]